MMAKCVRLWLSPRHSPPFLYGVADLPGQAADFSGIRK